MSELSHNNNVEKKNSIFELRCVAINLIIQFKNKFLLTSSFMQHYHSAINQKRRIHQPVQRHVLYYEFSYLYWLSDRFSLKIGKIARG